MHDLQHNGGRQLHAGTDLTAACVHKSATLFLRLHKYMYLYAYITKINLSKFFFPANTAQE